MHQESTQRFIRHEIENVSFRLQWTFCGDLTNVFIIMKSEITVSKDLSSCSDKQYFSCTIRRATSESFNDQDLVRSDNCSNNHFLDQSLNTNENQKETSVLRHVVIQTSAIARNVSYHLRFIAVISLSLLLALIYQVLSLFGTVYLWRVMYPYLPLRSTSRLVGIMSKMELPRCMRKPIYYLYAWIFTAELNEAEHFDDLSRYHSFWEFFGRRLRPSVRNVDEQSCLVSFDINVNFIIKCKFTH